MSDPPNALVALVRARGGDAALGSALAAAAHRITSEAKARVRAHHCEATQLRREAWRDLHSAKADFEASRRRASVIRDMELDEALKTAALRTATRDLARSGRSLRRAAEAAETAVATAKSAEAQAEAVASQVAALPEVVALEALRGR